MPVDLDGDVVTLRGEVDLDDATQVAEWVFSGAAAAIDLAATLHLHGAALQALLIARVPVVAPPRDPFIAQLVASLLVDGRASRERNTPG